MLPYNSSSSTPLVDFFSDDSTSQQVDLISGDGFEALNGPRFNADDVPMPPNPGAGPGGGNPSTVQRPAGVNSAVQRPVGVNSAVTQPSAGGNPAGAGANPQLPLPTPSAGEIGRAHV